VRALLNHDPNQVLGRTRSGTLRLYDEQRGLRFELDLPDSPLGENVREAVRRKDIDGASFRFKVGRDGQRWDGDTRTLVRIDRLLDASIATLPAYPDASIELRTKEDPTVEVEVEDEHGLEEQPEEETRTVEGGSLRVADRHEGGERVEQRSLLDSFRAAGWTPGSRAEIGWTDYEGVIENRALTWAASMNDLQWLRRDSAGLGADQRYVWPSFGRIAVDAGTTAVQVLTQTARSLPSTSDVIRDIDETSDKPEAGSTLDVVTVPMKQIAAVQSGIPNVFLEQDQLRSIVGQDLRLALNEALDQLVLDALATAGFQDPASDPLLVSIRKAITTIQSSGYSPNLLILDPESSEALDLLTSSGPEAMFTFGAGRFAPGDIFGLSVRVSKSAPAPVVADSDAFGKLYASPVQLASFEENFGKSNSTLLRLEGHAAFGTERSDAAIRIAAT
jgi:HK97 family phage prohead protease